MSDVIFVDGTLKEGFPNFHANKGVRMAGEFLTSQRFPFYLVGERCSPWLVNSPGQGEQVAGEVFRVDQATLDYRDALERITEPDGYRRRSITVVSTANAGSNGLTVFAYLKDPQLLEASAIRLGPLAEYMLQHAAMYKSPASTPPSSGQR